MNSTILSLEQLIVRYGKFQAIHGITASFEGGCLGLLGANGAGKSSLLRSILGLVTPHSGNVKVFNKDIKKQSRLIRSKIGYMPERDSYVDSISGVRGVAHMAQICGIPKDDAMLRAHDVMHFVGLGEERYREVKTYSVGMRQRYKLAAALAHDPDILFLDEPTNGLDPKSRSRMLGLIERVTKEHNIHLVLASHLLADVEKLCDQVWVLDNGIMKQNDSIAELTKAARGAKRVRVPEEQSEQFLKIINNSSYIVAAGKMNGEFTISHQEHIVSTEEIFQIASQNNIQILAIKAAARTLEDAFLETLKTT